MKKFLCICTLLFVLIAIAGCASSTPPRKTEVNVTTPPTVNVTPPATPKVDVNVTTPPPQTTPKK